MANQSHVESLEMWCWGRIEKNHGTDLMRNAEVLQRVKKQRKILQTIKMKEVNWIGHVLCRNCLLRHVTEGNIEGRIDVTERRGRRQKKLMNDLEKTRRMPSIERESTRSPSVENSLWRRLGTCNTGNKMMTENGRRWSRCSTTKTASLVRNPVKYVKTSFYMSKNETDLSTDVYSYTKMGNNISCNLRTLRLKSIALFP
jgi:hypothetical protein